MKSKGARLSPDARVEICNEQRDTVVRVYFRDVLRALSTGNTQDSAGIMVRGRSPEMSCAHPRRPSSGRFVKVWAKSAKLIALKEPPPRRPGVVICDQARTFRRSNRPTFAAFHAAVIVLIQSLLRPDRYLADDAPIDRVFRSRRNTECARCQPPKWLRLRRPFSYAQNHASHAEAACFRYGWDRKTGGRSSR